MNVAIEELSPCQKKLTIGLSAEEVNQEFRAVLQDVRKNVTLPGFRKGRASVSTIKRRLAREIKSDVKEKLLERSLKDALMQNKISPIGTPNLADVNNLVVAENQPVEYTAEVEFVPAFELTNYKGVSIPKPKVETIPEAGITQTLDMLRQQNAVNQPVEDAEYRLADHDSVTINYQRTLDGQAMGNPVQNFTVWLGVDQVLPEFQQHLLGRKQGEHLVFPLKYGEDYQDRELAGKTVEFAIDIVKIEKMILPELDDEFAKDVGEDSLAALKQKIEADIRARMEQDAIAAAKHQVLMKIAETQTFDVPPSLIKEQKAKYPKQTEEELTKMLRAGIVLSKIQSQENITVTDDEVEHEIEHMAMRHRVAVAAMKNQLARYNALDRVRSDLLETKTLDFLYANAALVEE